MTKPTIRELLEVRKIGHHPVMRLRADDELAERVEAVLALTPIDYAASDQAGGFNECLQLVRSLLDGEQP